MKNLTINRINTQSEHSNGGTPVNMHIKNQSHIMVELDNISFNIEYMNQKIGKISSSKFKQDCNALSFNRILLPDSKERLDFVSKLLANNEVSLSFVRQNNIYSSIFWLQSALDRVSLNVTVLKRSYMSFNCEVHIDEIDFQSQENSQFQNFKSHDLKLADITIPDTKVSDIFNIVSCASFEIRPEFISLFRNFLAKLTILSTVPSSSDIDNFEKQIKEGYIKENVITVKEFKLSSDHDEREVGIKVITKYLKRELIDITIKGNMESIKKTKSIYLLKEVFKYIKFDVSLLGNQDPCPLVTGVYFLLFSSNGAFTFYNPFNTNVHIIKITSAKIKVDDKSIADAISELDNDCVIESKKDKRIQVPEVSINIVNAIRKLIKVIFRKLKVNIKCMIKVGIGVIDDKYIIDIEY
ncbi:31369_t:CDS:2, partial [Gigaspora margarita]